MIADSKTRLVSVPLILAFPEYSIEPVLPVNRYHSTFFAHDALPDYIPLVSLAT
jgi:hypothetical protein